MKHRARETKTEDLLRMGMEEGAGMGKASAAPLYLSLPTEEERSRKNSEASASRHLSPPGPPPISQGHCYHPGSAWSPGGPPAQLIVRPGLCILMASVARARKEAVLREMSREVESPKKRCLAIGPPKSVALNRGHFCSPFQAT